MVMGVMVGRECLVVVVPPNWTVTRLVRHPVFEFTTNREVSIRTRTNPDAGAFAFPINAPLYLTRTQPPFMFPRLSTRTTNTASRP
jgi:hypothetical protein